MKMNVHRSMLWAALIGVAAAALPPMVTAQAGASPYQFALPAGWTRAQDGDVEVLSPGSEPAGSVQVLVLAVLLTVVALRQCHRPTALSMVLVTALLEAMASRPGRSTNHFQSF